MAREQILASPVGPGREHQRLQFPFTRWSLQALERNHMQLVHDAGAHPLRARRIPWERIHPVAVGLLLTSTSFETRGGRQDNAATGRWQLIVDRSLTQNCHYTHCWQLNELFWERIASRRRPAFSSHLLTSVRTPVQPQDSESNWRHSPPVDSTAGFNSSLGAANGLETTLGAC